MEATNTGISKISPKHRDITSFYNILKNVPNDSETLCDELLLICIFETALRSMMAPELSKVENRNKSPSKTLELYPEDNTLTFTKEYDTPSTGLPMRTDTSPPVITCPKLLKNRVIYFNMYILIKADDKI